jgi:hypothetical protein
MGAFVPLAVSIALAMGCSAKASSTDVNSGVSATTACTDSAHATCIEMSSCTPASLQATYGDEATCELRIKTSCLNSLSAAGTGASAELTEACAQAYGSYPCSDYRNKTLIPPSCAQAKGSVPTGGACEFPGQCLTGFCAIVPGSACGTCATLPQPGDSCALLTSCGQTLTCTTDTLVCTSLAGQGQACGAGQPCGAGLSCVAPGGTGTPGTCQQSLTLAGSACDGSLKLGPSCEGAIGLYCDGLTKQCALTTYASAGQPCGYDSTAGTNIQCTGGTCEGSDPSVKQLGVCAARAPDDGPCSVPDGGASTPSAGCLPPARCIASEDGGTTCQVVQAQSCQ